VLAWSDALTEEGMELSIWRIHRRIGMSGGLLTNMLLREIGLEIEPARIERLQQLHSDAYKSRIDAVRPLPGAAELLSFLTLERIPWAVATSGKLDTASLVLAKIGVDVSNVPIITRDQVRFAKPDPDLFIAAAERLNIDIGATFVVGDSVWDMLAAQRARALGIGVLSGGYGLDELERAGAYRVFDDPAHLLRHIDELGARR
jgi:HAD superfamily hydrolase (TIGR01549 family)